MQILIRLIAYLLIGCGAIILVFFDRYPGGLFEHTYYYVITAFVLIISGIVMLYKYSQLAARKKKIQDENDFQDLLKNGERILVPFSQCRIVDLSQRAALLMASETKLLPVLDNPRNRYSSANSVLVFEQIHEGKKERFISAPIGIDATALALQLDVHKQTWLYVNRQNRSLYFFDTDLLFSENNQGENEYFTTGSES